MTESQYAKCVLKEPHDQIERDGEVIFDGILATPEMLGQKCQTLFSIVTKAHVNEPTPHYHKFPIILTFAGTNPEDIFDFDAEIEFTIGGEKQVITTAAVVVVPPETYHCPLVFKRVGKPIAFCEVHLTDKYVRYE